MKSTAASQRQDAAAPPASWVAFDEARWRAAADASMLEQPWRALPAHVSRSSVGRPWRGLMVWHQVGPQEDLYIPPAGVHCVLLRRGTPTQLLQRQGDTMREARWQPGEAVIVPAGVPTFWRSSAPRDNIHIDLAPAWLRRSGDKEVQLESCFGRKDPVLASFGELLLACLDSNSSLQPGFGEHIAQALALHLIEHYARPLGPSRAATGLSMKQVKLLAGAVAPCLHEPWPVARMAAVVGLSAFHFSRAFKATLGMTPHGWISLQRMEVAARMVRGSGMPLVDIAVATGYPSAAHFSQAFRRHWGMPPSVYRRA